MRHARVQADLLNWGLRQGCMTIAQVRQWADCQIESSESLQDHWIDLSFATRDVTQLLQQVPGEPDTVKMVQLGLAWIHQALLQSTITATRAFDLCMSLYVPEAQDAFRQMAALDISEQVSQLHNGLMPEPLVRSNLLACLQPFAQHARLLPGRRCGEMS